jgi:hypothetical protein
MGSTSTLAPIAAAALAEVAKLEARIGGRDVLIGALATATLDKPGNRLLHMLADPSNANAPLLELCRAAGLRPGALIEAVSQGLTAASHLEARVLVAQGTPAVVRDVMVKAAPREETCYDCGGTQTKTPDPTDEVPNPSPEPCATCNGRGTLAYAADPEARKLALDLSGLLPKAGGISITNTQQLANVVAGGGSGDGDRLQEAMDQILFGGGPAAALPPIDVTPTPSAPADPV